MARLSRYVPEVQEWAVMLFHERAAEHLSPWAAVTSSSAPGFSWTLDCERVLAGGDGGSTIRNRRRWEPVGRPEGPAGAAVGAGCRSAEGWRQLRRDGHCVARCTVRRLMRAMGLQGTVRGRAWVIMTQADARSPQATARYRSWGYSQEYSSPGCRPPYLDGMSCVQLLGIVRQTATRPPKAMR